MSILLTKEQEIKFEEINSLAIQSGKINENPKQTNEFLWWCCSNYSDLKLNGKKPVNHTKNNSLTNHNGYIQNNSKNLLIVEDNPPTQKLIHQMLKKNGIESDIVNNGKEAVEAAHNKEYGIILMDIQMPVMNGLEATEIILEKNGKQEKPVIIAITSCALPHDKKRCFEAGMKDYIQKPIRDEVLVDIINKWMNKNNNQHMENINRPILDMNVIEDLRKMNEPGENNFMKEITDLFLSELPKLINDILISYKNKDINKMVHASHSLKGASLNIGAARLADLCKDLEMSGRENNLSAVSEMINILHYTSKLTAEKLSQIIS